MKAWLKPSVPENIQSVMKAALYKRRLLQTVDFYHILEAKSLEF